MQCLPVSLIRFAFVSEIKVENNFPLKAENRNNNTRRGEIKFG